MANKIFITFLFFISIQSFAQIGEPILVTQIDVQAEETSGLILHNNELWTHNDSGGASKLYSIDTTNGSVIRIVNILNAENNDWEDICKDENYAYIGDIGNNSGARDDLKIYRVSLTDLENSDLTSINSEIINFSYDPEIYPAIFKKSNNTNFDCEAIIAFEDSLYLFSKNWIDKKTYLYALPKTPGTYIANLRDTLNTNGLVCGADYCAENNTIAIIGYIYGIPAPSIMILLSDFEDDNFFDGTVLRKELSLNGCQTEGIVFKESNKIWFSNENFLSFTQALYSCELNSQGIENHQVNSLFCNVFPNPSTEKIQINFPCNKKKCKVNLKIFNSNGEVVISNKIIIYNDSISKEISVSELDSGKYILQVSDNKLYFQTTFIKL
jgi:hypothetical protein